MADDSSKPQPGLFDYGWITSVLLLLFLSLIPLLLPMADAVPEPVRPDDRPIAARKHPRVVIMMVDGLGYRKAVKSHLMPYLEGRIPISAFGMALASFPTITPTGLRAIFSGHRMTSEPQLPTGMKTSPELDSVMSRATAAGLKTFVIGQFAWPPLFPGLHGAQFVMIPYKGPSLKYDYGKRSMVLNYDDLVLQAAAPILAGERGPWDLLVLHLFETDSIGHATGTEDSLYTEHLPWLDHKIEDLSRSIQEEQPTTFLLVADHGQAFDGAHGGLSDVERQVPFMMWGADVVPGDLGTFPLYNAAATMCALLGIPPPAQSEGRPMLAGMQTTSRQRAEILLDLARQRARRWQALKSVLPKLPGNPPAGIAEIEGILRAKKYDVAAARADGLVQFIDSSIEDALPGKWLWRLIAALWAIIFAACFSLAWRQVEIKTAAATSFLSVACVVLLAFPLLRPNFWGWASAIVLAACVGILLLTLIPGLTVESGLDRFGWGLWWCALLGMGARGVLDIGLWSGFILAGLFVGRGLHLTKKNAATTALSLLAVLACAVASAGTPSVDVSPLRSHLPSFYWPLLAGLDWRPAAGAVLAVLLAGGYFAFVRYNEGPHPRLTYALIMSPLVAACALMQWAPTSGAWSWAACAVSLVGLVVLSPSQAVRGMWLSAICLTYYRTMTDERQWCLLALAVLAGCCLAWKTRDAHPLWEGMGLLAIGLWSFKQAGGQLSFSSITVAEGYRVLGEGWHPYALLIVLTLKTLAAIGAPIMPRMAVRPLYSMLGILPLMGALSAGNLSLLCWNWVGHGGNIRFTDDKGFAQTIFVLILTWCLLGLWAAVRALEVVPARLRR